MRNFLQYKYMKKLAAEATRKNRIAPITAAQPFKHPCGCENRAYIFTKGKAHTHIDDHSVVLQVDCNISNNK